MKTKTKLILGVVGLVGVCVVVGSHHARTIDERDVVVGELVVDFRDDVKVEDIQALGDKLGITLRPESSYSAVDKIYIADGIENTGEVLNELRGESIVDVADFSEIYTIPEHNLPANEQVAIESDVDSSGGFPNDPLYSKQWHLKQDHLPESWKEGNAGSGVIISILDTGCSKTKDMVDTKFVPGYNFIENNTDTTDFNGHGSWCGNAATGSTNNGIGVSAIAYKASLMPIKVLSDEGSGSSAGIAQGIRWAVDHGSSVLSLSLGGGNYDAVLANAIKYAHSRGAVVICASGNSSRGEISYPSKYPESIAVGATDIHERKTFYSNYGEGLGLMAPGGGKKGEGVLQNTIIKGKDEYYQLLGTSMSTPQVAGIAALVIAEGIKDPDMVRKILFETARMPAGMKDRDDGFKTNYGHGIVDGNAAVKMARGESGGLLGTHHWLAYLLLAGVALVVFVVVRRKRK